AWLSSWPPTYSIAWWISSALRLSVPRRRRFAVIAARPAFASGSWAPPTSSRSSTLARGSSRRGQTRRRRPFGIRVLSKGGSRTAVGVADTAWAEGGGIEGPSVLREDP